MTSAQSAISSAAREEKEVCGTSFLQRAFVGSPSSASVSIILLVRKKSTRRK
jgi:hypothetical protein